MSRIPLGILCGLIFGGIDTAMMIPLSFPDKRAAMLGAFIGAWHTLKSEFSRTLPLATAPFDSREAQGCGS